MNTSSIKGSALLLTFIIATSLSTVAIITVSIFQKANEIAGSSGDFVRASALADLGLECAEHHRNVLDIDAGVKRKHFRPAEQSVTEYVEPNLNCRGEKIGVREDPTDTFTFNIGSENDPCAEVSVVYEAGNFTITSIGKYPSCKNPRATVRSELDTAPPAPTPVPAVPTSLSLSLGTPSQSTIVASWSVVAGEFYRIRYKDASSSNWDPIVTDSISSTTIIGLKSNTTYQVQIRAIADDTTQRSAWSDSETITTAPDP